MRQYLIFITLVLMACAPGTPEAKPLPKPRPTPVVMTEVPLVMVTGQPVAAALFRVTWGDSVKSVRWLTDKLWPVDTVAVAGKISAGAIALRKSWDTVAIVTVYGKIANVATPPWRFMIDQASAGKANGYQPTSVSMVSVIMGKTKLVTTR
jgi:hypothetical protein